MDGFEATMRIKDTPEIRNILLVAVTAQAMPEDKERVMAAGADGYITKPIDLLAFRSTLEAMFR